MTNLLHSSMPPLADLRSYLQVALPDSHLTEAKVDPSYEPLLLLRTNHFLAAFAFSNGDVRKSYESIYTSFKQHYAERRGQWDSLDLSFVFCVKPDLPELAQFCSSIETDVYFCRKFVVPLSASVGSSLARLPFIPLTQLTGQSFRPPSARTFLNQCGVPTVLAKYLVVQRTRAPEAIVEDCINGDFGVPRSLAPPEQSLIAQPDQTAAPITVESLTIENFRAYRRPQTFSLGSDVTVLYGANGFGKTSVFDAFDFATTGDIGRINSRSDQHFLKTATHLDSKPEDSAVSLSFWSNGALRKLTRTVSDRKHAVLDGIPTDRKPLLSELTSGNFPAADRVENFVSLFRATHLFNQEQPELTKDFRDDCRLPSEIVARMLAFEDYVSAVSKATKVREHLDSVIATANSQIRELTEQIADETSELKRLAGTATTGAPSEGIDNELQSLSKKLEELGLSVGSEKADVSVLRGWRASLMGRLAESHSKTERLSVLDREIDEVIASRTESKRLDGLISEGQRVLAEAAQLRIPAESALKLSDQTVFESNREITSAQTRIDLLTWIRDKRPEYDQLIQRERSVTEVMGNATSALAQDRDLEDSTAIELRKTDELRTGWTESLDKACEQLTAVEQFTEAMVVWRSNEARLLAVIESENEARKAVEMLGNQAPAFADEAAAAKAEEAGIARSIAEVDKGQSELKRLTSQLISHVVSGICPVCGEDHGSRDELLRRIEQYVSLDVASGARAALAEVRGRSRTISEQIAEIVDKQQASRRQLEQFQAERLRLNSEIGEFKDSAQKLEVSLDVSDQSLTIRLQALHTIIQREIEGFNRQLKESVAPNDALRSKLGEVRAHIATRLAEISDQTVTLDRVRFNLGVLRNNPRAFDVPLDSDEEQVKEFEENVHTTMLGLRSRVETIRHEAATKKSELAAIDQNSATLKRELTELRNQLAKLRASDADMLARLEQESLPPHADQRLIRSRLSDELKLQALIGSLSDSVSSMELALDTATTSAALTQFRQNVRNKEKVVGEARKRIEQNQPWSKYFTEVCKLVSSKQSEAIASFTREYGPRTSVIQRRLRSVYGFEEVEIRSEDSEIRVRVKRHGEELRPTDYFSQSQQQTLFLGLFLTACISQTWSAFSPIFLDDPVTHFDDLNTYAFLDLVVGLLEPGPGRRQFVISTCDEKLLQLARQKFRHLGDKAKFFRFSSISDDGPTVEEIRSS